jgi:pilus assembly protein Flp/PilA
MLAFIRNEEGATAIEYGLICAFLVLAIAAALPFVGVNLRGLYQQVSDAFGH